MSEEDQREQNITAMLEAAMRRLTREQVSDTELYDQIMDEVEKEMISKFDVCEMEADGDAIEGDIMALWVRWDEDEHDFDSNEIEFAVTYDEGVWQVDCNGFT
jgi:SOS response regulatory protein OraA/RecX